LKQNWRAEHPIGAWWKLRVRGQPLLWLLGLLLILLGGLQYRLWFAPGSLAEQHRLELQVQQQTEVNRKLRERNAVVEREVLELQTGTRGVEQRAREQLGLIREGETFYLVVDKEPTGPNRPAKSN
jgi:cell division protein FtsB